MEDKKEEAIYLIFLIKQWIQKQESPERILIEALLDKLFHLIKDLYAEEIEDSL